MSGFFRKLGWMARRRHREEDLAEELRFHLEEDAELRRERGIAEREARWSARRELGNLALVQEDTQAAWGWTLLEQFAQDLRYAWRAMGANRVFTALAVASLALGIGANAAIYSFMDALLLRSLPVTEPDRLALLSVFGYFHQSRLARRLDLTVQGQADVASVEYVSGEFFSGLGVPPAAGQLTIPEDDREGAPPVAVVGYGLASGDSAGPLKPRGNRF
jgi:MacB-like periplasmic core domain